MCSESVVIFEVTCVFSALLFAIQCLLNCNLFLHNISDQVVNISVGRFLYFVGFFYHISYGFVNLVWADWLGLLLFWVVLSYFGLFQTLVLDIFLINVSLSAIFTASAWKKLMMLQTDSRENEKHLWQVITAIPVHIHLVIQKLNWWSVLLFLKNYTLFHANIVSLWILKYLLQLKNVSFIKYIYISRDVLTTNALCIWVKMKVRFVTLTVFFTSRLFRNSLKLNS